MNPYKKKLILGVKMFIFSSLVTLALPAAAEYYLVNSASEENDMCVDCQKTIKAAPKHHRVSAHRKHHYYHRTTGLFVYYPNHSGPACACCPPPAKASTVGSDNVLFSTEARSWPKDRNEPESTYSADLSTADDITPDMERD